MTVAEAILFTLAFVAILFLIIQIAALVMGLALARSITSSIHELFAGTERVRHMVISATASTSRRRIRMYGDLADSFTR